MSGGSPKTVGWIGVGKLGGPMVGRLAEAGFDPVVYDANPDARTALAKATLALFEEQAEAGMADDDFFSAVRLLERKAGLGEP